LHKIAHSLQATIIDLEPQQPGFEPKGAVTLQRYLAWYNETRVKLEQKAQLLQNWREELQQSTDQLYPELLHYADVIGATCIGSATAKGLESVEFDLAIIDEAGQIGLPDLLVPLVRAKRAVLVGDYNQLPPFMSNEVESWLENLSSSLDEDHETINGKLISNMLAKSAFEQLFTTNPPSTHSVSFTRQGRMPQMIADFVSDQFYNKRLGTFSIDKMQHTIDNDPIFRHALTLIDTSDERSATKWEQRQTKYESLDEAGYINVIEAKLIANLAEVYERTGKDWIVIVPYRAQARLIIQELKSRIDTHNLSLEERVATVHSFQGGERKKVIYGFTRSNTAGKIGFLKEVRLLNVAMTRAQQHLILVGNFAALTRANDARFSQLITDLQHYALQNGDFISLASCYKRLHAI
jgi:superfamily I DNA and/or RNA helicase